MTFRKSTIQRNKSRLLIATQERDAEREAARELYGVASKALADLNAQVAYLKEHPFRNVWDWLMGR